MSTIKDVAAMAGVSASTVSRVLSGKSTVSEATEEKVWNAVRATGYSVNETARLLRCSSAGEKKHKHSIDCIFARDINSFIDPFFTRLLHIIEPEVFKFDYRLRCQYAASDISDHLPEDRKDGAIILGRIDPVMLARLKASYRYLVYVGLQDRELGIDSVICRGYDAAAAGLEKLISLGHRKICYLGETEDEQRYDAYCDVIKRHGLEEITLNVNFTPEDSCEKLNEALNNGLEFTAVFCANDISALGVYKTLKEHGLSVPEDISVVGINDAENVRYLEPMLTTVNIPIEEMGHFAARLIIDRIERGHKLPVKIMLPGELIVRDSCCQAKKC